MEHFQRNNQNAGRNTEKNAFSSSDALIPTRINKSVISLLIIIIIKSNLLKHTFIFCLFSKVYWHSESFQQTIMLSQHQDTFMTLTEKFTKFIHLRFYPLFSAWASVNHDRRMAERKLKLFLAERMQTARSTLSFVPNSGKSRRNIVAMAVAFRM